MDSAISYEQISRSTERISSIHLNLLDIDYGDCVKWSK